MAPAAVAVQNPFKRASDRPRSMLERVLNLILFVLIGSAVVYFANSLLDDEDKAAAAESKASSRLVLRDDDDAAVTPLPKSSIPDSATLRKISKEAVMARSANPAETTTATREEDEVSKHDVEPPNDEPKPQKKNDEEEEEEAADDAPLAPPPPPLKRSKTLPEVPAISAHGKEDDDEEDERDKAEVRLQKEKEEEDDENDAEPPLPPAKPAKVSDELDSTAHETTETHARDEAHDPFGPGAHAHEEPLAVPAKVDASAVQEAIVKKKSGTPPPTPIKPLVSKLVQQLAQHKALVVTEELDESDAKTTNSVSAHNGDDDENPVEQAAQTPPSGEDDGASVQPPGEDSSAAIKGEAKPAAGKDFIADEEDSGEDEDSKRPVTPQKSVVVGVATNEADEDQAIPPPQPPVPPTHDHSDESAASEDAFAPAAEEGRSKPLEKTTPKSPAESVASKDKAKPSKVAPRGDGDEAAEPAPEQVPPPPLPPGESADSKPGAVRSDSEGEEDMLPPPRPKQPPRFVSEEGSANDDATDKRASSPLKSRDAPTAKQAKDNGGDDDDDEEEEESRLPPPRPKQPPRFAVSAKDGDDDNRADEEEVDRPSPKEVVKKLPVFSARVEDDSEIDTLSRPQQKQLAEPDDEEQPASTLTDAQPKAAVVMDAAATDSGIVTTPPLQACDLLRLVKQCSERSDCTWTSESDTRGFFCITKVVAPCPKLTRKTKCVARPDCVWTRVSSSRYGCKSAADVAASRGNENEEEDDGKDEKDGSNSEDNANGDGGEDDANTTPKQAAPARIGGKAFSSTSGQDGDEQEATEVKPAKATTTSKQAPLPAQEISATPKRPAAASSQAQSSSVLAMTRAQEDKLLDLGADDEVEEDVPPRMTRSPTTAAPVKRKAIPAASSTPLTSSTGDDAARTSAAASKSSTSTVADKEASAGEAQPSKKAESTSEDDEDEEDPSSAAAGGDGSDSSAAGGGGENEPKAIKPCSSSKVRSSCSAKPHCVWASTTKTRGHYCEDKIVRATHPDAALFRSFISSDLQSSDDEEQPGLDDPAPLDWIAEKKLMMCSHLGECATRDNITQRWPSLRLAQAYKQSQCCSTHPHLKLMLHAVADFFTKLGVHWWIGPDEAAGSYFSSGRLLPWQASATVYVAVFGGALPDVATEGVTMLKSTKNDFVTRLVKFNADQRYFPYSMRVCANKFASPKGRPPTYSRDWLNATRLSVPSCYLAKSASGLPASKTPIYLSVAHADMDPSPMLYIIPKMVRGGCVEPWRPLGPGAPRDNTFLPLSWVLPAKPCPNGLYGRRMNCPRDVKAMDLVHFSSLNTSAWQPTRSTFSVNAANFTSFLINDFCRPQVEVS